MFLGGVEKLLQLTDDAFPELGLQQKDCIEMSWIESTVYFAGLPHGTPIEALLDRTSQPKISFKAKSDYVTKPISVAGLEGLWQRLLEEDNPEIMASPYGGRMSEISEREIAFPHRAGNIYLINYMASWQQRGGEESEMHLNWIRRLYDYMGPHVSNSPRTAYFNFKDLDLGQNKNANTTYLEAKSWGEKYFKSNFETLVYVKNKVDPDDFFYNEQSIPSFLAIPCEEKRGEDCMVCHAEMSTNFLP
ncbi:hypothetical protein Scep_022821 [Stephania cephalantha]|uniref:Berberine/berberine-like domain-containing protein n=1 Tax=Stephania cephalantha TaxID=152367 RepID=A0AAP0FCD5_9MAGN